MDNILKKIIDSENIHELNVFLSKNKFSKNVEIKTPNSIEHRDIKNIPIDPYNKNPLFIESESNKEHLYVDKSSIHEYGIFSKKLIHKSDIIEICYTIELEFRDKYHKDRTILDYAYVIHHEDDETIKHGHRLFLITGYGMLYNHDSQHNAEWKWMTNHRQAILIASQDIHPMNEITISYGSGYWDRKNVSRN